jgi:hypothetical protein
LTQLKKQIHTPNPPDPPSRDRSPIALHQRHRQEEQSNANDH